MTKIRQATMGSALVILLWPLAASAANTWYVAPTGSDSAAGSMAAPFATWGRAQTAAAAGDTVYFRGGTYKITTATSTCGGSTTATVDAIVLSKSGTAGNMINYWAFPGETPLFDFSGITDLNNYNCRHSSVRVTGSFLYLKGFELTGTLQLNSDNHESWCVYVTGGSNNKFELINAHHNMGPGFFIVSGGNNTFLNCDSHENEDTLTSNGDGQSADGFGCHPEKAGNTGNLFHGCRAWWNSDDAWDFINSQEACTVEYSWAWYQGYKPDALNGSAPVALAAGNGNGFKGGGYGDPQTGVPATPPQHVLRFNVSFDNKANGFYANHEIVSPFFYNNTSYNNGTDFDMLGLDGTTVTSVGVLRNNLAFGKTLIGDQTHGGPIDDQFNSWDTSLGLTIAASDFQSVSFAPPASCPATYSPGGKVCVLPTDMTSFAGMASARQADGSLPVLPFLRLSATSRAIDKGTNIGFPFVGKAPDLGAFEFGAAGGMSGSGGSPGGGTGGASGGTGGTGAGGSTVTGSGGASATGGSSGGGGASAGTGGSASGAGGSSSTGAGGASVTGTGGSAAGGSSGETGASGGCACTTAPARDGGSLAAFGMLALLGFIGLRSRRRAH